MMEELVLACSFTMLNDDIVTEKMLQRDLKFDYAQKANYAES
jgi:hypothetical protein